MYNLVSIRVALSVSMRLLHRSSYKADFDISSPWVVRNGPALYRTICANDTRINEKHCLVEHVIMKKRYSWKAAKLIIQNRFKAECSRDGVPLTD